MLLVGCSKVSPFVWKYFILLHFFICLCGLFRELEALLRCSLGLFWSFLFWFIFYVSIFGCLLFIILMLGWLESLRFVASIQVLRLSSCPSGLELLCTFGRATFVVVASHGCTRGIKFLAIRKWRLLQFYARLRFMQKEKFNPKRRLLPFLLILYIAFYIVGRQVWFF